MKLKAKLTSVLLAIVFTLSLMIVGVLSATQVNLGIGGNVTFTARGVNCTISEGLLNDNSVTKTCTYTKDGSSITKTGSDVMPAMTFSTERDIDNGEKLLAWTGLDLNYAEHGEGVDKNQLIISFSITNNSDSDSLAVSIKTKELGTNTNMKDIAVVCPDTITPGATANYSLTFEPESCDVNSSLTGFNVSYLIERAEPLIKTDKGYPYITMGKMSDGSKIVWRYVGYRTGTEGNYSYINSSTPVAGQTAIFVQETNVIADRNIGLKALDYETCDLRTYLNSSQFIADYGLTDDSLFASGKLVKRSLYDLFTGIKWGSNEGVDETGKSKELTDSFWIMSAKEVWTLIAGQEATGTGFPEDYKPYYSVLEWKPENNPARSCGYWLRTTRYWGGKCACVIDGGGVHDFYENGMDQSVRTAFLMEI